MELIVLHDGRETRLQVERQAGGYRVRLGDRLMTIDSAPADGQARSLLIEGRQYEVTVRSLGNGRYLVATGGGLDEVTVCDPLTHLASAGERAAAASGARTVTAYMPGRVVEVLVEVGAEVAAGQGLVVLEAMKMENEIQAETGGTVREIFVESGQAVERGDPLFALE